MKKSLILFLSIMFYTQASSQLIDSLVIYPDTINISQSSRFYEYWKELEVSNPMRVGELVVADFNNNGFPEIYGQLWAPNFEYKAIILELDSTLNFNEEYIYPDTVIWAVNKIDIDSDSSDEMILSTQGSRGILVFKYDSLSLYPTNFDFFFSFNIDYQINWHTFGDFDKDGNIDYAFFADAGPSFLCICEYNPITNNFDSVFAIYPNEYSDGILAGDFDYDNKTELVFSSEEGLVEIVENYGNNLYKKTWDNDNNLYNSYYSLSTEDFNNNGYPEFWIMGDDLDHNEVNLLCYENKADDEYKIIHKIIIKNSLTIGFSKLQYKDINKDGILDFIICLGNRVLIFDINEKNSLLQINLLYYNEFLEGANSIDNINFYNLENKNYLNLLFSYSQRYTKIYRSNLISNIGNEIDIQKAGYSLEQNYPNPFNSNTTINYNINKTSFVSMKIYNLLGQELKTIFSEIKKPGNYSLSLDFSNLASGIYIYQLNSNAGFISKKFILLK